MQTTIKIANWLSGLAIVAQNSNLFFSCPNMKQNLHHDPEPYQDVEHFQSGNGLLQFNSNFLLCIRILICLCQDLEG